MDAHVFAERGCSEGAASGAGFVFVSCRAVRVEAAFRAAWYSYTSAAMQLGQHMCSLTMQYDSLTRGEDECFAGFADQLRSSKGSPAEAPVARATAPWKSSPKEWNLWQPAVGIRTNSRLSLGSL